MMQRHFIQQNDMQKMSGTRWREFLQALAKPATRVHNYRNLTTSLVDETIGRIDCRPCDE